MNLKIGDNAPDFTLPTTDGGTARLADYAGQILVLFFYPRDDTKGCTIEAIAFSGLKAEFDGLGATVLGVSKDSIASHDKFIAKHDLTVPLLSDEDSDLCERCGIWVEKSMYGKTFMGIERSTILVGRDGKMAQIWRKVSANGHAEDVLEAVRAISG